jgi:hypothetical protein
MYDVYASRLCAANYKFDPAYFFGGIAIQAGEITRGQALHFAFPSRVGHLDVEDRVREIQRASSICHDRAANQGPGEKRDLFLRNAPERTLKQLFQSGGDLLHGGSSLIKRQGYLLRIPILAPAWKLILTVSNIFTAEIRGGCIPGLHRARPIVLRAGRLLPLPEFP